MLLVAAAGALLALAVMMWMGVIDDISRWRAHRGLDSRGVTVEARVDLYRYDPEGGDPDGWTSEMVTFSTPSGRSVQVKVGHHGPGVEGSTRSLRVTYDPKDLQVARAADYADDDDTCGNAIVGSAVAGLLTGLAAWTVGRLVRNARGFRS